MPGPMLTVNITESARRGFWAGPLLVVGHGLVELLVVLALVFGLGHVLQLAPVSASIGVVGGIILLWMAWGMLRGAWQGTLSLSTATANTPAGVSSVITGGLVSISNPYWILWWATVGLSYVAWSSAAGGIGLVAFFGGHILSDLGWFSLVALLVAGGRKLLNDGLYRAIIAACGLFLVALSCYFVASGLQHWLNW
jgi:threonine/homoserine/homoserine lactone efflux protein